MISVRRLFVLASLALTILWDTSPCHAAPTPAPFPLRDGDRIVFLGDGFFERESTYGQLEAAIIRSHPGLRLVFRNLSWSADTPTGRSRASFDWSKTPADWLKRVREQVDVARPTVILLSYHAAVALDPELEPAQFIADLGKLIDVVQSNRVDVLRFAYLDHPGLPGIRPPAESTATDAALMAFLTQRGIPRYRLQVPNKPRTGAGAALLESDRIHWTEVGYRELAADFVRQMGQTPADESRSPELLLPAIRKKNELFFHRYRPENWTYLFGFRQHEQGRNAKEISEFDPLINEWDGLIQQLVLNIDASGTVEQIRSRLAAQSPQPNRKSAPSKTPQPVPTFSVAEGFEVTLWAENPSLHKPIGMNFDPQGRLWIASSEVYPQIQPGQPATDSIVVLQDVDGDGRAEKHTVFVDGLLIPTGVVPGNGGVYVAQSSELLFFRDSNGDGVADERRIVATGFGTEDTHHNLHSLRWGYDGRMYLNQSIYTHSHIETPHGVARLNSGGIWRFDPTEHRWEVFTRGGCNPWGHHYDAFGNSFFTDGAGFQGVYHAVPGAMYFTYAGARRELASISPGNYPKFAGLEMVRSEQFPDDWQGTLVTCDFRAHRVVNFAVKEAGSTFQTVERPDLLRSTNLTFRPIDVKSGPDGALYIADWSNPIIQHGEVDFRDARRDKEHGRIWRVSARNRPALKKVDFANSSTLELLSLTLSKNDFTQSSARRVLHERGPSVLPEAMAWLRTQTDDRAMLEVAWLHTAFNRVEPELLRQLAASRDFRLRTAATRLAGLPESKDAIRSDALRQLAADEHPRVRLESIRALARRPTADSADASLTVLSKSMDPTLDYALWLTVNDLAHPFIQAVQSGAWSTAGREKELTFALKSMEPALASRVLGRLLSTTPLDRSGSGPWIEMIGSAGTPAELNQLAKKVNSGDLDDPAMARSLDALTSALRLRKLRPTEVLGNMGSLVERKNPAVQLAALNWLSASKSATDVRGTLASLKTAGAAPEIYEAAWKAFRETGGSAVTAQLSEFTAGDLPLDVRSGAAATLLALDPAKGASSVVALAREQTSEESATAFWRRALESKGSGKAVAEALVGQRLPQPVARAGSRVAREGGRQELDLVVALAKAGGLASDAGAITSGILKDMAAKALAGGSPQRGEAIYRRADLACISCHAIGGAGGKVGPDMTSIGASAPMDYLIESILMPNSKIKEGYHALAISTKDGQELTGVLVRETGTEVLVRNAANAIVSVPKADIESRSSSPNSLMPSGLLEPLSETERLDLFAFLGQLGKPGEFDASRSGVARKFHFYTLVHTDVQNGQTDKVWSNPLDHKMWTPVYTRVNGRLSRPLIEEAGKRQFWSASLAFFAATEIETQTAGSVDMQLTAAGPAELWIDGAKIGGTGKHSPTLKAGKHRVLVKLDPKVMPEFIHFEAAAAFVSP